MGKTIIWTHQADAELNEAFLDLLEQSESLETTTKIITEIYESAAILATNPEIYKLDILKENNNGNIRAYEKHTYRISYLVEEEAVYIIRVRYARKEPLGY
ncbi:Plasmid stabilization system protein ParE [Arenibacter nanhaiticus]|uniref:Plasmid stabilization system protein ParE n=1 Tax=Arenibacter nanhaiticus TaxID=558155 RepID=A0A1M6KA93_9FLAO|nr:MULTISPECIES: type II toxin-antitoxin system RelE/ParE family toxin [Arenibacter]MDX1326147.1 type II toxin-antitoxin system RelE/ParE family toxin [Arenibacter sp.]NKI25392.1 type II toxin-antitoxin system RelE/ParE family toxin [Arenibacter sp. 6A1]SHJ55840.1 Plasmid stabilization system protein ParE [Arenibacter nanhaiticus]